MIKLTCGEWSAAVLPELGANIAFLEYQGQPVLYPYTQAKQAGNWFFGTPILLPANRTENACFSFRGKEFVLSANDSYGHHIHGRLMMRAFHVTDCSGTRVVCGYDSVLEDYPFLFRMIVTAELMEEGLKQTFTMINRQGEDFPIVFGLHTTFNEPDIFSVPINGSWERNSAYIPTGRLMPLRGQEVGYPVAVSPHGLEISGFYQSCGNTAKVGAFNYQTGPGFDQWVLYNGGGREFLCLEPQAGRVNGLNSEDSYVVLPADGKLTYFTKIYITGESKVLFEAAKK